MDRVPSAVRSRNMAAIRSKHNRTTEMRLRLSFVGSGIRNWHMHETTLPGTPDFVFKESKLAVFVHGCFWHACPKCYRPPASSRAYWESKARRNTIRDRTSRERLRQMGWLSIRLWEHDLKDLAKARPIIELAIEHQNKVRQGEKHVDQVA